MAHPLVHQLRFTRSEFRRGLEGISAEEATRRLLPINSLNWIICHLAGQERRYWLVRAQGITDRVSQLDEWGGYGKGPNTPPLTEAWAAWEEVVAASDPFLDGLTDRRMLEHPIVAGKAHDESLGTMLQRVIYHYWFHNGEASAVRQLLGHRDLPEFVGDIGVEAPFRPT
jgi:hypothetical protein